MPRRKRRPAHGGESYQGSWRAWDANTGLAQVRNKKLAAAESKSKGWWQTAKCESAREMVGSRRRGSRAGRLLGSQNGRVPVKRGALERGARERRECEMGEYADQPRNARLDTYYQTGCKWPNRTPGVWRNSQTGRRFGQMPKWGRGWRNGGLAKWPKRDGGTVGQRAKRDVGRFGEMAKWPNWTRNGRLVVPARLRAAKLRVRRPKVESPQAPIRFQ